MAVAGLKHPNSIQGFDMAAKEKTASRKIGKVMHEYMQGELRSGASGEKVKSRKQAIAIALSEASDADTKTRRRKPASRR